MNFPDNGEGGVTSNFYDIKRESSAKNTVKREFIFIVQIYPWFVLRLTKFFYLFVSEERDFERRTNEIFPVLAINFDFWERSRAERGEKKREKFTARILLSHNGD